MASTYVNDLRLNEMATGDASGTWGTNTNVNLELIGEAMGYGTEGITTNANTHTSTIADGATDPVRAMYVEYTGTLDSACTITIGPNTVSKLWFIENGTSGSQNILISQGSGANVTIPAGDVKAVYSDGAGSGAAMIDAFASLNVVDLKVQDDLTVTDDATVGGTLGVTGVLTANAGVVVDNITIDGTEIDLSSGDLTLDAAGDIILDADGGNVTFKDGGTAIGDLVNSSSDFVIESKVQDKDIIFKGDDGGSVITALTLDMSEAGAATFNDTVTLGTNKAIQFVDANESVSSDGTNLIFTSGGTAFKMPTTDGNDGDVLKTDGAGTLSFASSTLTASDDTRVVTKNNKAVGTSARTVDYFQSSGADVAWYFMALTDLTNDHSSASCFTVAHNNSDSFISGARGGASGSDNSMPTTSADISSSQVRVKIVAPSADSKVSYYKIPLSRANTANETAGVTITTANTDVDSASESIDTFAHASFRAAKYTILIDDDAKTDGATARAAAVNA